ncbi:amidohydrolase family protein [Chelatococcus asaccharovorans]|uniref:amidohydrolase family protein n=1 Tax=Chelatococcus asaccharovorans TaxID=28210 RepID=UPI00224C6D24|nr:amidohydrolase family protein [Chelatococcus asaccharovorans]CAH1669313.1 putative TIM-barrel fold metal-dependent hydrolase [Chelatococcus asaccharovorans]CAH1679261.1 putative TIM-barrel fold metal-dependent hydrolase [Chelatococcus asaccharovorans]
MALEFTGALRYPNPRVEWLALQDEDILDPSLPIVDPHHHIWAQEGNPYGVADLAEDIGHGHRVVATVFVEAHSSYRIEGPEELKPVGETEAIEKALAARPDLADRGLCRGIVGKADLTLGGAVERVIAAHSAASPERFRGVRHLVTRDPHFPNGIALRPSPEGLLKRIDFREGLATLARHGLSFDAMLYHSQLSDLIEVARFLPELAIVLDHFGCPLGVGPYKGREDETFRHWRENIRMLAACPNVAIKMGGMGMVVTGATWHESPRPPSSGDLARAWQPLVETAIEAFGVDRCMFESNFPVDKGMFSYPVVWNAFKRLAAGASTAEKAALFHNTAVRVYRLPIPLV